MTSVKDTVTKAFQAWGKQERENRAKNLEAMDKATKGIGDTIYFAIEKVPSKQGQPDRVRATAVSGLPGTDTTLVAYGTDPDHALFEARHQLLDIYWNHRMPGDDWTATRRKATSAKLEIFSIDMSM